MYIQDRSQKLKKRIYRIRSQKLKKRIYRIRSQKLKNCIQDYITNSSEMNTGLDHNYLRKALWNRSQNPKKSTTE